jgi:hypothetical protein
MRKKNLCPIGLSIGLWALLWAVSAGSCNFLLGPEGQEGTLTLILPEARGRGMAAPAGSGAAGASRAVLSDGFIGGLVYRFTFTRSGGGFVSLEAKGGKATVSLAAGKWAIAAAAYDPGAPEAAVGYGSAEVTMTAGRSNSVIISMRVDPAYEADLTAVYIHTEAELRRLGAGVNGLAIDDPHRTFYLENDIVLTQPWNPVGDEANAFKAKFDGQGHTITLNGFADLSAEYLGLFGYTRGAEVKNLRIECNLGDRDYPLALSSAQTSTYVGAAAGFADGASVFENIRVSGSLGFSHTGGYYTRIGGITGGNHNSSRISSCHVRAAIYAEEQSGETGSSISVGGIAGENQDTDFSGGGIIEKSSFAGTLRGEGDNGSVYAGGIVGDMFSGEISDCYASGRVEARSFAGYEVCAGGIAGGGNRIERCYARVFVHADGNGEIYGGGIGGVVNSGTFSQCYALGGVTVTNNGTGDCRAGGITGKNYQGTVEYCAALNDVRSNNSADARGIAGRKQLGTTFTSNYAAGDMTVSPNGTPLPDTDLDGDSAYALADFEGPAAGTVYGLSALNWDFTPGTGGWKFISGYGYPVLFWQTEAPADGLEGAIDPM